MRILYVFPHPDDESFGPAPSIARLKREGHEVHLLTLTRGGATRMRHKFGYSVDEMGEVRFREMEDVAETLELDSLTVWDYPDSGLKEIDPRPLKKEISDFIKELKPNVVVTYPVHGISGFHDHLVCHAIMKDVYLALKDDNVNSWLKRLAFFTLDEETANANDGIHKLSHSTEEEIDCEMEVTAGDVQQMRDALACYRTYQEVIEESIDQMPAPKKACFEFYLEEQQPPVSHLCEGI